MARITYTAIVSNISGTVAGSTFKRNKSGGIILNRPHPKQTRTDAQYDKRRILSLLSGCWQNITTTNKELWDEYASITKQRQSGFNAYLGMNMVLLSANYSTLVQIQAPPPTPQTPTALTEFSKIIISSSRNSLQWALPRSYDYFTQVYYCIETKYSLKNKESWKLLSTIPSMDGFVYHDYLYPYGTPIFYYGRTIDAYGRTSPRTEKI